VGEATLAGCLTGLGSRWTSSVLCTSKLTAQIPAKLTKSTELEPSQGVWKPAIKVIDLLAPERQGARSAGLAVLAVGNGADPGAE